MVDLAQEDCDELEELIASDYAQRFPRVRVHRVELLEYLDGRSRREFVVAHVSAREAGGGGDRSAIVTAWVDEEDRVYMTRFGRREVRALRRALGRVSTTRDLSLRPSPSDDER